MNRQGRAIGLMVAVFGLTGLGLGGVAYVAADWATTIFLLNAQGETAVRLGPVFVALVAFMVAVLAMFVGPLLAVILGVLFGSKQRDPTQAAISTGGGAFFGFLVMGVFVLPGILLGIGAGGSAPFGSSGYLVRLAVASVPTALVGAVAGALGVVVAD